MDQTTKKENSLKGVRLQGFKGFKLKNTQILFKPNLSKKTFSNKTSEKIVKSSAFLKSPDKTTLSNTSANLKKNEPVANIVAISDLPNKTVLQEQNEKKSILKSNLNSLLKDENLHDISSVIKKNFKQDTIESSITQAYQQQPLQQSTTSQSSKLSNTNSSVFSNHKSNKAYDGYLLHSSTKRNYNSRSPNSSDLSEKSLPSRQKRKKTSTSSLSSQSSDDDEVMRKTREKRKASQKSSETYTPRKKVRETEDYEAVSKMIFDFDKNETSKKKKQEAEIARSAMEDNGSEIKSSIVPHHSALPLKEIKKPSLVVDGSEGREKTILLADQSVGDSIDVLKQEEHHVDKEDIESNKDQDKVALSTFSLNKEEKSSKNLSPEKTTGCHLPLTSHNVLPTGVKDASDEEANVEQTDKENKLQKSDKNKMGKPEKDYDNINENKAEEAIFHISRPSSKLDENDDNDKDTTSPVSRPPSAQSATSDSADQLLTSDDTNYGNSICPTHEEIEQKADCNSRPTLEIGDALCNVVQAKISSHLSEPTSTVTSTTTTVKSSVVQGTNFDQTTSSESVKLIHPAKKRYREWVRSMSLQENELKSPARTSPENKLVFNTEIKNAGDTLALENLPLLKSSQEKSCASNLPQSSQDFSNLDDDVFSESSVCNYHEDGYKAASITSDSIDNSKLISKDTNSPGYKSPSNDVYSAGISDDSICASTTDLSVKTTFEDSSKNTSETQKAIQLKNFSLNKSDVVVSSSITDLSPSNKASTSSMDASPTLSSRKSSVDAVHRTPSPPVYDEEDSPVINYSISDDESSLSGLDAMSPIDIRIPIDNDITGSADESKQEKTAEMDVDKTPAEIEEDAEPPAITSVIIPGNDDLSEEGIRRSARIKTQVKKKKPILLHQSSEPDGDSPLQVLVIEQASGERNNQDGGLSLNKSVSYPRQTSSEIKSVDGRKPPAFETIEENIYLFQKKKSRARKEIRRMLCECISAGEEERQPCGENCLNRLLMIECSARCPYGDLCTNKRFQRGEYMRTEVFETSWKGWGLRAAEFIPPGKLVMEYCGEVLDPFEFYRRSQLYAENNQQHFYFMALSQDEIIDATYKGNNSRFINHSCDPNCETQKWTVNGRLRVGFFSVRGLEEGEEITFDYQFERYGKEAQKCFCGSHNCRGYLGKPPRDNDVSMVVSGGLLGQTPLQSSFGPDKERKQRSKIERFQEFKENTLESEISRLNNGLQTTKEVLLLSRLMVRSESIKERIMCLHVIRKSNNQGSLRAFLHFHGLPLIWSWMVDVSGGISAPSQPQGDVALLKTEILKTLAILPINNRNILEDSKVLSMVKRWSEENSESRNPIQIKSSDDKDEEKSIDKIDEDDDGEKKIDIESGASEQEKSAESDCSKPENIDQEEKTKMKEFQEQVISLSTSLLDAWKDLKEIYRIPKRQRSATDDATSQSNTEPSGEVRSQTSPSASWGSSRAHGRIKDEREKSSYRDKDGRNRDSDRERRHRRSPVKIRSKDDATKLSTHDPGNKYAWLETSGSSRLSREEHRRQFERDVRSRDEKKLEVKQLLTDTLSASQPSTASLTTTTTSSTSSTTSSAALPTQCSEVVASSSIPDTPTFTPSVYSGNLIQINPSPVAPPSSIVYTNNQIPPQPQLSYVPNHAPTQVSSLLPSPYLSAPAQSISVIGAPPPPQILPPTQAALLSNPYIALQQSISSALPTAQFTTPALNTAGVTILGYYGSNAIVLLTPEQLKELTDLLAFKSLQQVTVQQSVLTQPQPPLQLPPAIPTMQPPVAVQPPVVQQPAVQEQSGVIPKQPEPSVAAQLTPTASSAATLHETAIEPAPASNETPSETSSNAPSSKTLPKDPRPPRLPPNWKTASDADGCVYYYHVITRQTQWDPPTWDASVEDMVGKKEGDMEMSSPKQETLSKKKIDKMAATAVIASDTEQAKKAKESFRTRMSQHIVTCLGSYRKSDCKVGRITSNEDFKKLARKLTYNVLMKEIKQVQVWEDLECNANVKHKAKEYVRKYMAKMGPVYKSKDDDTR